MYVTTDEAALHTTLCLLVQGLTAKTALLVRRLRISPMRAANILDRLEAAGIISAYSPAYGRKTLFNREQLVQITRSNEKLQRI